MDIPTLKFNTVDEYISAFPAPVQELLLQMRVAVKEAAPQAKEVISYNMPAIKQHGVLVYYAAAKEHIGFYPTAAPIQVFKKQLEPYKTSKGAIQFPMDRPLPLDLVKEITAFRLQQDHEKAELKKQGKKNT